MQSDGFVSVRSLVQDLAHVCQKALTGCLYFVSSDNHVGKFVLKQGQIVLVRYYRDRDKEALGLIRQIDQVKYHFSDKDTLRVLRSESLPENKVILQLLGFEERLNNAAPKKDSHLSVLRQITLPSKKLSDATRTKLQDRLVAYIGPIASILCQRAFDESDDLSTVVQQLVEHIPDAKDVQDFIQLAKTL